MATDKRIDDLELSVRTSELLRALGVETVDQLQALPQLTLTADGSPKLARMMRLEIEEALAALGVVYAGQFVMPEAATVGPRVTGDVNERWRAIHLWLKNHHSHALEQWKPPATASAIAQAEADLGVELPLEYKAFLALHNGQTELAPMLVGALLPVEELAAVKNGIDGDDDELPADRVGKGVRAVEWSDGWIPIARSASGTDYLCLDLDPAADGTRGQVIQYRVDASARPLLALGFADLLSIYFEQVQSGALDLSRSLD